MTTEGTTTNFSAAASAATASIVSAVVDPPLTNSQCCSMRSNDFALVDTCTFWIEGVFIVLIGSFGILGNLLSISVLCSSVEMKNVFNLLLILLSSVDSLLIALAMLDYSFVRAFNLNFDLYVYMFPYFLYPTANIVLCVSIFLGKC